MRKLTILILLSVFLVLSCKTTDKVVKSGQEQSLKVTKSASYSDEPAEKQEEEFTDAAGKICSEFIKKSDKIPNKTAVVANFYSIDGEETVEGRLLTERIVNCLVNDGTYTVIERNRLSTILEEQKLEESGLSDSETAVRVGKLLNAGVILFGSIAKLENYNEINARVVDTETSAIIIAVSVKEDAETEKRAVESLAPDRLKELEKERKKLIALKRKNPELFRQVMEKRERLNRLKENNPVLYHRLITTLGVLKKLSGERPAIFLLVTEPKNSPKIRKLREEKPKIYQKVQKLRKSLKLIVDNSPLVYRELVRRRAEIIRRMSKVKRRR